MDLPEMITVKEIQDHLHVSKNRAYELVKMKGFPKIQIGSRYLIPKEKYIKWLEENIKHKIIL